MSISCLVSSSSLRRLLVHPCTVSPNFTKLILSFTAMELFMESNSGKATATRNHSPPQGWDRLPPNHTSWPTSSAACTTENMREWTAEDFIALWHHCCVSSLSIASITARAPAGMDMMSLASFNPSVSVCDEYSGFTRIIQPWPPGISCNILLYVDGEASSYKIKEK